MNAPDLGLASRLAKICACTIYLDKPGGIAASPWYAAVGFDSRPRCYVIDDINACCLGAFDDNTVLAFRGTIPLAYGGRDALVESMLGWLSDADQRQVRVNGIEGRIQRGCADTLLQLWPLFMEDLQASLASGRRLVVTGHSKGGAVAALAASRLQGMDLATSPRVYTFGAPRAGDRAFAQAFAQTIEGWRFENRDDIVPHLPWNAGTPELLRQLDGRFRDLDCPDYSPAGSLEFISWSGKFIAPNGPWLDTERTRVLAQTLADGRFDQLARDHGLEQAYIPAMNVQAPG